MDGHRLSTNEKGAIVGMSCSQMSQYCIARDLGIPRSTIECVKEI